MLKRGHLPYAAANNLVHRLRHCHGYLEQRLGRTAGLAPALLPVLQRAHGYTKHRGEVSLRRMFAAINTVEPPILDLVTARLLEGDKPRAGQRLPLSSTIVSASGWADGPTASATPTGSTARSARAT